MLELGGIKRENSPQIISNRSTVSRYTLSHGSVEFPRHMVKEFCTPKGVRFVVTHGTWNGLVRKSA